MTAAARDRRVGRLRALTWNVHGGVGADGRYDLDRIARLLCCHDPDIVALQEVDTRDFRGTGRADMADVLAATIGVHRVEARAVTSPDGHYGQLVACRWPLSDSRVHDVSVPGREDRRVIETWAETPAGRLRVLATHLGLAAREHAQQAHRLERLAADGGGLPTLLLGDLNDWRPFRRLAPRLHRHFGAGTRERTFPARLPLLSLDRIWCGPGWSLRRSWTDRAGRFASDHLPVIAASEAAAADG